MEFVSTAADKKPVVKASIDFWEDRTCVRFRPATSSDKDVCVEFVLLMMPAC